MGFEDWLFGLHGEPIDEETYLQLQHADFDVLMVGRDAIGTYLVSTVWIGVSSMRPPLIYETAVFDEAGSVIEMHRWPSRQIAEVEHQRIVEQYRRDYGNVTNGKDTEGH